MEVTIEINVDEIASEVVNHHLDISEIAGEVIDELDYTDIAEKVSEELDISGLRDRLEALEEVLRDIHNAISI